MRVLLTGHTGYIGTVLTPLLIEAGHEVVGLDTGLFKDCTLGELPPPVDLLDRDLRDVSVADLEGFEAVVHLGGLSNDPLGDLAPELTEDINHLASVRLAQAARQAGVSRFVFSSSCSTYGAAGDEFLDESADFNPVTPYGVSKVRVEQDVAKLVNDDFSPVYLRNATAYGVSARHRMDLVLNELVASAMLTGLVFMKSDGTPWRPIVHIRDISAAMIACLAVPRERIHNQAFNVGRTDQNYRIRELAEIVRDTVPNCTIEYADGAGPDKRCYRVNCDKIRTALPEFVPQWDAAKGARELYDSYRAIGLDQAGLDGTRFRRLGTIQALISSGRLDDQLRWK